MMKMRRRRIHRKRDKPDEKKIEIISIVRLRELRKVLLSYEFGSLHIHTTYSYLIRKSFIESFKELLKVKYGLLHHSSE